VIPPANEYTCNKMEELILRHILVEKGKQKDILCY